ncbi:hypothetical protein D3C86_1865190 [compost metagenome]
MQETEAGHPGRDGLVGDHLATGIGDSGHGAGEVADFHRAVAAALENVRIVVGAQRSEIAVDAVGENLAVELLVDPARLDGADPVADAATTDDHHALVGVERLDGGADLPT